MTKRATALKAAGKAKPAAAPDAARESRSGPVEEASASTGPDEDSEKNTEAPQPAQDAPGQQAKPEAEPVKVDGEAAQGMTIGVAPGLSSSEAGEASGDGSAAAASDTALHPASPLIEEARAARDPSDAAPAPEQPGEPDRFTYPVRSPLRHDRRRYSPDDPESRTVEMTEAEAETLIALGVLGERL